MEKWWVFSLRKGTKHANPQTNTWQIFGIVLAPLNLVGFCVQLTKSAQPLAGDRSFA